MLSCRITPYVSKEVCSPAQRDRDRHRQQPCGQSSQTVSCGQTPTERHALTPRSSLASPCKTFSTTPTSSSLRTLCFSHPQDPRCTQQPTDNKPSCRTGKSLYYFLTYILTYFTNCILEFLEQFRRRLSRIIVSL